MILPPGFAAVAPYLFVRDAAAYLDFLTAGLGGSHLGSSLRPDGKIANGQVRSGGGDTIATIMVSEASDTFAPGATSLYLYVEDADSAMTRAVMHGAASIMPVGNMPYGDRQGGVRDAWNTIWWLSQRLTPEPYAFD